MTDQPEFHSRREDTAVGATPADATAGAPGRAAELTRLLADASFLPTGSHASDVGWYRALEVISRGPGHYWATADVIDDEGTGHVEVIVSRRSTFSPPSLSDLRKRPSTTGQVRQEPDGSVITTSTTSSAQAGVIIQRAILLRPDGTYVDVVVKNEDSRTSGRTRPTPPLDADTVLSKIAHLRP